MRAAVIREVGKPPVYSEFPDPEPKPEETIVAMTASAVNPLTLSVASGAHYSGSAPVPFVAGVDGVGRTPAGLAVYVSNARAPFGTLAERVPASTRRMIPIPSALSDTFAAAVAIPGLSCWNPLVHRARIQSGESVLVHGATGAGGYMAIQIAKHLGARAVIATGRNRTKLAALKTIGADRVIALDQPADSLRTEVREIAREFSIGVVLDYIFGPTAAALIAGLGGPGAPRGSAVIRYVQIGSIAGPSIPLEGTSLRSSGLEILGSGIGSSTMEVVGQSLRDMFAAAASAHFRLETDVHPLPEVAQLWGSTGEDRRLVFSIP